MAAKRSPRASEVTYTCTLCPAKCNGDVTSILAMLAVCQACFDKRRAKGLAEQRRAEAQEAARAG